MKKNIHWTSENEKAHGANWRQWLGHLKDTPATGLELGTWMGESAEWMLTNIFTHPDSVYICVDTFAGSEEHKLAGIDCSTMEADTRERLEPFGDRVVVTRALSHQHGWTSRLDFVYVDAAHDSMNVLRDAVFHFEQLKPGGIMIFDDYEWTVMPHSVDCPKPAIDAFLMCYGKRLEVIGLGWQVAIRKIE